MPGLESTRRLFSFRDSMGSQGEMRDPNRYFSTNSDVQEYFALLAANPDPDDEISDRLDSLFRKILRAVRSRKLQLDYAPPIDGRVTLPEGEGLDYLQAVLFWCAHLEATIPRLVEAHARAGDGATAAAVREMLDKIAEEDEVSRTDTHIFGGRPPEGR